MKWPNDVLLDGRKVAGILAEGRPQEGWAVLGIGVNVAVEPGDLVAGAATLGRSPDELDRSLADLLRALERRLAEPPQASLAALRERDALLGRHLTWASGSGTGDGIDERGALRVRLDGGGETLLDAGEVHLG